MDHNKAETITITGCGGFIGSHLLDRILGSTRFRVYGIDTSSAKIKHLLNHPQLQFRQIDIRDTGTVRECVADSGTVISLAALCNPSLYNTEPLDVIDMNFTRPVELVKACCDLGCRLIHFSTCEVYGKTAGSVAANDAEGEKANYLLREDSSPLIMGPVKAQRWSYGSAKQLLERVIYAYGFEKGLQYTIVRPFNFIGPRMDFLPGVDGEGIPRVIACFINALLRMKPLKLVDGGLNRRCFTYIDDAVDAVMAILQKPEACRMEILNIGNPENEITISELAFAMIRIYKKLRPEISNRLFDIENVSSKTFYGRVMKIPTGGFRISLKQEICWGGFLKRIWKMRC